MEEFRKELETLINRHSMENGSNTPDFILANYLVKCLEAFDEANIARDRWYGRETPVRTEDELLYEKYQKLAASLNYHTMCARSTIHPGKSIDEIPMYTAEDLMKYAKEHPTPEEKRGYPAADYRRFKVFVGKELETMIGQAVRSWGKIIGSVTAYDRETGEAELQLFEKFEYEKFAGEKIESVNLWGLVIDCSTQSPDEKPGYPSRDNADLP